MGDSVLGEERLASISSAIANDVYNRLCRWEGVEPGCLQDIKDTMLDNKTAIFNNFKKKIVLATSSLSNVVVFSGTLLSGEVAKVRASRVKLRNFTAPHFSLFVSPSKIALLRSNLENL